MSADGFCKPKVGGSIPSPGTVFFNDLAALAQAHQQNEARTGEVSVGPKRGTPRQAVPASSTFLPRANIDALSPGDRT